MTSAVRPHRLIVVAGTATEVGKTWVTARLVEELRRRRVTVAVRKPAQSYDPADHTTDADVLGAASAEAPEIVCPPHRWYPVPMAPPMASDVLDRGPVLIDELLNEVRDSWPGRAPDVGIVELAGGVRSPMSHDADGVDLVERLAPDLVVLVADAGLGTINAVRLSAPPLVELAPVVVVLNRFDGSDALHAANLEWLSGEVSSLAPNVDTLLGAVLDILPAYCTGCGLPAGDCPGGCAPPLDPPRHCPRCGRRMAVTITPTGSTSRCRDHGELGSPRD
ncbi:MAG TPA: dethiobiotin synthase [Microthrixaceae bacterium]|nr:dethiobiotin synthase [Microthrixaceae bacterium]